MNSQRKVLLMITLAVAAASAALAAVIWGVIIWRLGLPFNMPFMVSLQTARAARVFTARYLLSAVFIFIAAWIPTRYLVARRRARQGGGPQGGTK